MHAANDLYPQTPLCSAESETQIQASQLLAMCVVISDSTLPQQCCGWWSSGLNCERSSSLQLGLLSAECTGVNRERCIWQWRGSRLYLTTYRLAVRMCTERNPTRLWYGRDPKSTETTGSLSLGFDWFLDQLHNIHDCLDHEGRTSQPTKVKGITSLTYR